MKLWRQIEPLLQDFHGFLSILRVCYFVVFICLDDEWTISRCRFELNFESTVGMVEKPYSIVVAGMFHLELIYDNLWMRFAHSLDYGVDVFAHSGIKGRASAQTLRVHRASFCWTQPREKFR